MISTFYFVKNDSVSVQSQSNQLRSFIRFNPKSHIIVVKFESQFNVIALTSDKDYVKYKALLSDCFVPFYREFFLNTTVAVVQLSKCLTDLVSEYYGTV